MRKGYEMTAHALTQRRRTGTALIAVGALLLALAALMLVGVAPTASAGNHEEPENGPDFSAPDPYPEGGVDYCHWTEGANGYIENNFPNAAAFEAAGGAPAHWAHGDIIPGLPMPNLGPPPTANSEGEIATQGDLDENCGVDDTTTTTVADTTTTTLDDTTTTAVGGPDETTTTVLGPDDPELPDTGPGELLALLAGGLGLTFIGSGSLVIAGDRRRAL
jgi:hypothetical protein